MNAATQSPVSFPVDVRRLPQKGFPVRIEADEQQLAALAEAHGLLSVERFTADLLVQTWKRDGVRVSGAVEASIVQECVVTLEPLQTAIHEQVDALFVPEWSPIARPVQEDGEVFLSAEGPDAPETFDGKTIDAGAAAEEFFGLAIEPYPRKPGAELASGAGEGGIGSAFEKLRGRLQKD